MTVSQNARDKGLQRSMSARARLGTAVTVGAAAGVVAAPLGATAAAPLIGFDAMAVVFSGSVWATVWRYGPGQTARHADRDDPSRGAADLVVLIAAVASLVAVGVVLLDASNAAGAGKLLDIGLAVCSAATSWVLVHTVFALDYARLYCQRPGGGIDFNQKEPPRYTDFAYLAFTIGMTFQVSDTQIGRTDMRRGALRYALLAYLFGAVIVAVTINLVAGLTK